MIYKEDKHIKIGGVALPGLVRKFEITRTGAMRTRRSKVK